MLGIPQTNVPCILYIQRHSEDTKFERNAKYLGGVSARHESRAKSLRGGVLNNFNALGTHDHRMLQGEVLDT